MTILDRFKNKVYKLTHPEWGRVLMLHRVTDQRSRWKNRELEITPAFLERSIKEYKNKGYRFVSITEACDLIEKGRRGNPFVCLTFDDGYRDNYTVALPILKQENVPFAVYVTTGFVDNKLGMWWYPDAQLGLSGDELHSLAKEPLCTIGVHTVSHPRLDKLSPEEQRLEIKESKEKLESLLGCQLQHFSYPHGAFNDETLGIVREFGFRSSLLTWGGPIRSKCDLLQLPRMELRQP